LFRDRFQLSLLSVILLVTLRIAIGWHFFYEGMWKYKHPEFSAEGYFKNAKGPFAASFREQIPDVDGRHRLLAALEPPAREDGSLDYSQSTLFGDLAARASGHYGYSAEQQQQALGMVEARAHQAREYLAGDDVLFEGNEIKLRGELAVREYLRELDRLGAAIADEKINGTPFSQQRAWGTRQELEKKSDAWLDQLDKFKGLLRQDLHERVATADQQARGLTPARWTNIDWVNFLTIWTTLLVGFCLMVGLFTRLSAFVGAGFLMLVVAAMPAVPHIYPPPLPAVGHAMYINKEVIEMLALLFLATTPVGRWGGVDFFLHHVLFNSKLFRKEEKK
jgi:uncharacterized membrane protein YphA (DoxX/SURF4 family)